MSGSEGDKIVIKIKEVITRQEKSQRAEFSYLFANDYYASPHCARGQGFNKKTDTSAHFNNLTKQP